MNNNQSTAIKGMILVLLMLMFAAVAGVGILVGGAFAATPVGMSRYNDMANSSQTTANRADQPLESLLNDDGTLNLSTGFSGSVDPKGWRMQTGPDGKPRFVKASVQHQHPTAKPRSATSAISSLFSLFSASPLAPGDEYWDARFNTLGMNNSVGTIAINGTDVYVGGDFYMAGGVTANHIAKWDGSSWSALGSGVDGSVMAIATSGSDVYAGGWFRQAGGVTANLIAKWDGSSWSALGSGMDTNATWVQAIATSGSDVYVGGHFHRAGGVTAFGIARWDGSSWSAPGSIGIAEAVGISGSNLYVGGGFTTVSGVPANRIARWNGSTWSALGSGMNSNVHIIATNGSDVYAGGSFTTAGGLPANHIAKWDGSSWSALGSGMNGEVYAIATSGSDVYAGGWFTTTGGVPANYIAKWDGSSWSALGSGVNSYVSTVATDGSDVYVGGSFTIAGVNPSNYFGIWHIPQVPCPGCTSTPTRTPILTRTPTSTITPCPICTDTPTRTFTPTPTSTLTPCASCTHTPTITPTITHTRTLTRTSTATPGNIDAYAHFQLPGLAGAPQLPVLDAITTTVGSRVDLDLFVNGGTNRIRGAQNYMTFTDSLVQNVNAAQPGCVLTSTFTPDRTTFGTVSQNEICNGPGNCQFRRGTVGPGSMAFVSIGGIECPDGCPGDFRVAQIALCAVGVGDALIHWEFSPPAPTTRNSEVIDFNSEDVSNRTLYTDLVIHITDEPTPTPTNTPLPGLIGHLTWQNVSTANRPSVTGTLQLCVSGSTQSFPFTTDTGGNFTVTNVLPDGTYHWWTKGGRHISNSSPADGADLVISNGQATQEFGMQRGGNSNSDNIVNATDHSAIKSQFGIAGVRSADFDYNNVVNAQDFNILKNNFGNAGHSLTCP